ncbi:MAG: DNA-binding protein [Mesorhizobium sp.]|nr:DNA-binding protein [Mesorhizobium sp.]
MTVTAERKANIELVWGCSEIARIIGRSARATFHMLEKGELPAKKVGGRWVAEHSKLVAFFMEDAA